MFGEWHSANVCGTVLQPSDINFTVNSCNEIVAVLGNTFYKPKGIGQMTDRSKKKTAKIGRAHV